MADLCRQRLAKRLLYNWLTKNPLDSNTSGFCNIDEDLMSLGWLTNVQKTCEVSDIKPVYKLGGNHEESHKLVVHPPVVSIDRTQPTKCSNPYVKPPHSYATLITMAINSTTEKKINISSLYLWISENFPYFKMADNHWKNSIRHNLSLNKRFEKVPRRPNESGKGGFWRLRGGQSEATLTRSSSEEVYLPSAKRVKLDENNQGLTNIASGNDVNLYYGLGENDTQEIYNTDFNWSTDLPNDIYVDGVKIKTENILNEDEFNPGLSSPIIPSDDENSRSPFSKASICGNTSEDLSCFDDLLVFNCPDKPATNEREDGALDLCMPLDGNGGHDWWEKALDLSEECDVVSEKKRVRDEGCQDIYIPPLDNVFKDICDMFSLDSVF